MLKLPRHYQIDTASPIVNVHTLNRFWDNFLTKHILIWEIIIFHPIWIIILIRFPCFNFRQIIIVARDVVFVTLLAVCLKIVALQTRLIVPQITKWNPIHMQPYHAQTDIRFCNKASTYINCCYPLWDRDWWGGGHMHLWYATADNRIHCILIE